MTTTETIGIALNGICDDALLCAALTVSAATQARARRDGRLRYTRQGKRFRYPGQWVLDSFQANGREAHLSICLWPKSNAHTGQP